MSTYRATTAITQLVQRDHERLHHAIERVIAANARRRARLLRGLAGELARHEGAEQVLVQPVVRRRVRRGDDGPVPDEVDAPEDDPAQEVLARTEHMDPASPEFFGALHVLKSSVRSHAEHEERVAVPQLAVLDKEYRRALEGVWRRIEAPRPARLVRGLRLKADVRAVVGPVKRLFDRARAAARDAADQEPLLHGDRRNRA